MRPARIGGGGAKQHLAAELGVLRFRDLGYAGDEGKRQQSSGPVNLPNGGHTKTGSFPLALRGDAQSGDPAPGSHRPGTKRSIVG